MPDIKAMVLNKYINIGKIEFSLPPQKNSNNEMKKTSRSAHLPTNASYRTTPNSRKDILESNYVQQQQQQHTKKR